MKWTLDEDNLLTQLRDAGEPLDYIAQLLGRSRSAVCQRATRSLGLDLQRSPKRFWTEKEVETLWTLFKSHTCEEIAKRLKRTPQSVRDKAKNEGLFRRDHPL